jgi:hypothetical protein
MIKFDLGLYVVTVVLFHIISVVHLWLGGCNPSTRQSVPGFAPILGHDEASR